MTDTLITSIIAIVAYEFTQRILNKAYRKYKKYKTDKYMEQFVSGR